MLLILVNISSHFLHVTEKEEDEDEEEGLRVQGLALLDENHRHTFFIQLFPP